MNDVPCKICGNQLSFENELQEEICIDCKRVSNEVLKKEKILKVKAHIDMLKEGYDHLYEHIIKFIPYHYEDDVFEFEIVIRNIKDITKEVGINKEGARAYCDLEIFEEDPEGEE